MHCSVFLRLLLFLAASIEASIVTSLPAAIRLQSTALVATTRKKSLASTKTALHLGSFPTIRLNKENHGLACAENEGYLQCDVKRMKFGPNASDPGFLRKTFPAISWHLLPNWLTYCRCAAIPVLIVFFYSSRCNVIPCSVFAVASATDYLDGYLARKWDITSDFGAFLDPVVREHNHF